ncbi:hypothetical protein PT7_0177 [Pusillimonas sp. T7-7]|uniref:DUF2799 domain-containing protein n=1 Tax=Pusillimonas sp. (strain T7-7) TaxID=1007105 RepID=UPI000208482E|nr:DUF2799 domain-containing protein [Pusillimonas sp. T7-7]AEC18717.1 hypothetical protein PT7_0177 [Pusillimonas sp. T7-7]
MHSLIHTHCRSFRVLRLSLGITALVALSGCATMSEGECLTANWLDRGYKDGRHGYPASRVVDHREACSDVGVAPDMTQYRKGYDQGIAQYCTPANAVAEGRSGRSYGHVCPARLEGRFLVYYRQGRDAYDAQQRVDRLNRQSRELQRELDEEKDKDVRQRLRNELRNLDRRLSRARDELADFDRRLPYR